MNVCALSPVNVHLKSVWNMSCPQLFGLVVESGEAAAFWVGEIVISDVYPALSKSELPFIFTFCAVQLGFLSMHLEQKLRFRVTSIVVFLF